MHLGDNSKCDTGNDLFLKEGVYQLRFTLSAGQAPFEIALHGISNHLDALHISRLLQPLTWRAVAQHSDPRQCS